MLAKVLTIGVAISVLAVAPVLVQGSGGSAGATGSDGGTAMGAAANSSVGNETTPAAQSGTRPAHNRHLNRSKTPSGGATNTAVPSPPPQ